MNYNLETKPSMTFDEIFDLAFPLTASATMDTADASHRGEEYSASTSCPHDDGEEHRRGHHRNDEDNDDDMPDCVRISPSCLSEGYDEEDESSPPLGITGMRLSDIESRYRIDLQILGSGHHGAVRRCLDISTGMRRAVKSIRKDDPHVKDEGILREISLLREMADHVNIIRLIDVIEDEHYVHIVTELCEGGELFDKIIERTSNPSSPSDDVRDGNAHRRAPPCFAERDAARVMHQILTAVSHMHDRDIVHRDIKPENILFETTDENSTIKIIDLGLSRKHVDGIDRPMSSLVGTPYYIAPEVLRRKYDRACDLWSVGVVAYTLLCGYPPFNGSNNDEVYDAVRCGRYRFHSSEWSNTSRESRDFVRNLLAMDPRARMTAREAMEHPWILRHVVGVEGRRDVPSVEVVFGGSTDGDSIRYAETT